MRETPADILQALPLAYADWQRSTLDRITDALEERILLDRIGQASSLRILDVGCGDGVLATGVSVRNDRLAQRLVPRKRSGCLIPRHAVRATELY
jgi:hypothetical protein